MVVPASECRLAYQAGPAAATVWTYGRFAETLRRFTGVESFYLTTVLQLGFRRSESPPSHPLKRRIRWFHPSS
jgi:hypothetical protein